MAGVTSIPSNISDVESFIVVGGFSKLRLVKWMMQGLTWNNPWTYKDFDADEAVLKGVALIAHIFSGDDGTHYQTIADVTPLSLGVETSEGYMRKIIRRNTPVPTRKTENFTTAYDDQDSMIIRVFEGEHMMAKDDWLLGEFELAGIPRAPQGEPRIEVSFEVDADSNLRATAHYPDNTASSLNNSRNDYSSSIAWDEIDRIVSEAEQQLEKEKPVGTATATLERYIEIVERAMDRKDVVDIPGSNDDLKKEARNVVQATRKWISHKSAAASMEDFRSKEADLLEM
ncbi:hypothetical protein Daus18300_009265 [Diaporthe australafricana]|uniref:Uncharacterized protein n=1 Tax=Diaporthe australafricana TaxID=127596 RepID=A0ABR3WF24_9PEZI